MSARRGADSGSKGDPSVAHRGGHVCKRRGQHRGLWPALRAPSARRLGADPCGVRSIGALWCAIGYAIVRLPLVGSALGLWGHRVAPIVLVALGVYIFVEAGTAGTVLAWARR
jgi:hypothetical protein